MQPLWAAWQAHPGTRTLIFCCSVAHAAFAATWLAARGVRVARVYAAPGSDDRDLALTRLHRGELDAICAVDIFNEGVDVPALDRVVMLRPTESSVIFLQQLGRGLRAAPGKQAVTVLDFVGNHKIFLERLRTLLSLGDRAAALAALVATGRIELPNGCTVELALEAKRILESLYRVGGADHVEQAYRELRDMGIEPFVVSSSLVGVVGRVFEVADTGELPAVDGEVADEVGFGLALGVPFVEIGLMELVEGFLGFVGENRARRIQSMAGCVLGGAGACFRSGCSARF